MSSTATDLPGRVVMLRRDRSKAGAERLLSLAAAPTFAAMAALTGIQDARMPETLCSAAHGASPLTGMAPMYLLMAAFHLTPWLRLLSHRRSGAGRS